MPTRASEVLTLPKFVRSEQQWQGWCRFRQISAWRGGRVTRKHAKPRFNFFVYGPLTESERDIPTRYTEPNNEITRAWVMGRDKREFGAKWSQSGLECPTVNVSRDTV